MSESTGRYTDYIWDPNLYVNIMLYTFEQTDGESDILGISHMPYSVQGTDAPEGLNEVGRTFLQKSNLLYPYSVSINNRYLYASSASDNIISTLAHELGHYLGLYHVFAESEDGEQNLCIDSDYCTDTPTYNRTEYMLWVLTTAQDASFAVQAQRLFPGRIAVGVDAKDGCVAIDGWEEKTPLKARSAKEFKDYFNQLWGELNG